MKLHAMAARKESEDVKAESCITMGSEPPLPEQGLKSYWKNHNAKSIDGLPAVLTAFNSTTTFDESITSRDWGRDDERLSSETKQRHASATLVDLRLIIGFLLGILASGLWVNVIGNFALKSKVW